MFPSLRLSPESTHESVFLQRLDRVMRWARHIAGGDASLAEDLAQDAFLHFTTGRPSIKEIADLDKYLYVVLKNLYRSQLESAKRRRTVPFDPLAHDNARKTWQSVSPERQLTLRDELRSVCRFVCERKETSKGGSAFLLCFFHELSASDVSTVMRTTRAGVNERLSVIRREARRSIERPTPVLMKTSLGQPDLMIELQSIIASSCQGECFSAEEIELRYAVEASELPTKRLAHLSSCRRCLAAVAALVEFDGPKDSGTPSSAAVNERTKIAQWRRRRTELLSTEPSELRVVVNGHVLATERLYSQDSEFSVSVALREPLDFLEIWSGDSTRLLFLPVIAEPPHGKFEQAAMLQLNGGQLQLNLRFTEPWPMVTVNYQIRNDQRSCAVESTVVPFERESWTPRRFWQWLPIPAFSSVLALVLIVVLLLVQTRETSLSAAEMLTSAQEWEKTVVTAPALVLHRRFTLIVKPKGAAAQRTSVEVWRQAGIGVKFSRWTDSVGRVLAEARLTPSNLGRLEAGNIWQFEPSADTFRLAAGSLDHAKVSKEGEHSIIRTDSAELVLDSATNRPLEESFYLKTGDYVFTESWTETIPLATSPLLTSSAGDQAVGKRLSGFINASRIERARIALDTREEQELQVRRELHTLQLATAATVLRSRVGVHVQLAPTSIEQEQQLRAALAKVSGVKLSILSTDAAVRNAVAIGGQLNLKPDRGKLGKPLADKLLKAFLGSESAVQAEEERRVATARRLVSMAAEWRLLAERYPVATERRLNTEAHRILGTIVEDIQRQIRQDLREEQSAIDLLSQTVPNSPNQLASERFYETWQSQAASAADLLWENSQTVEKFYSPSPSSAMTMSDAECLLKLRALTNSLDSVLRVSYHPGPGRDVHQSSAFHAPKRR